MFSGQKAKGYNKKSSPSEWATFICARGPRRRTHGRKKGKKIAGQVSGAQDFKSREVRPSGHTPVRRLALTASKAFDETTWGGICANSATFRNGWRKDP